MTPPKEWLDSFEEALFRTRAIPLLDEEFSFPAESFAEALQETLGLSPLRIETEASRWETAPLEREGTVTIAIELFPLPGAIYWTIAEEGLSLITKTFLTRGPIEEGFTDRSLQEGFYRFLFLKVLGTLADTQLLEGISPRLLPPSPAPTEGSRLTASVTLTLPQGTVVGKIACSEETILALKDQKPLKKSSIFSSEKIGSTAISLSVQIGTLPVSIEEWGGAMPGDFLIFDNASYDLTTRQGRALLSLQGTPLLDLFLDGEETIVDGFTTLHEPVQGHTLTIEAALFSISIGEILRTEPGRSLPISLHPERALHLFMEGKKVASGELLQIGEVVGIRLTELLR
jgi:hypothetical protein